MVQFIFTDWGVKTFFPFTQTGLMSGKFGVLKPPSPGVLVLPPNESTNVPNYINEISSTHF